MRRSFCGASGFKSANGWEMLVDMQSTRASVDIVSHEQVCSEFFVSSESTFVLESPDESYEVEFAAKREDGRVRRTYSLFDKKQAATTPDVWGARDAAAQGVLAARLIAFAEYRVARVISGWRLVCEKCGRVGEESIGAGPPTKRRPKCEAPDCQGDLRPEQVIGDREQCAEPLVQLETAARQRAR